MLVQRRHALAKDSCQEGAYQKARRDFQQLADRAVVATTTLVKLSKASPWPFVDSIHSSYRFFENLAVRRAVAGPQEGTASAAQKPGVRAVDAAPESLLSYAPGLQSLDLCDQGQWVRLLPAGYPEWLRTVVLDSLDEFCFANKLSIDRLGVADPFRLGNASPYGPNGLDYDPVAKVEQRRRVQTGCSYGFCTAYLVPASM